MVVVADNLESKQYQHAAEDLLRLALQFHALNLFERLLLRLLKGENDAHVDKLDLQLLIPQGLQVLLVHDAKSYLLRHPAGLAEGQLLQNFVQVIRTAALLQIVQILPAPPS